MAGVFGSFVGTKEQKKKFAEKGQRKRKNKKLNNNFMKKLLLILIVGIFVYLFIPTAHAQTQGISVSPSSIQLDLATDKPQTTLTYTNNTSQTVILGFSTSDVKEFEDSYTVQYLDQKSAQNFKYGLSSWVEFSNSNLVIEPKTSGTITIFIDKDKLSPGGHYASILAQIQNGNPSGNVAIKSILATLVFVRTNTGKEFEKGTVTSFAPEQNFFDFPKNFLLRFTNSGDTFVTPYGIVKIYDMWGNYVGKGIVNTSSQLVLPETLRRMEIPTETFGGLLLPGMYHANLAMHFGKTNQTLTTTTTFFSFGTLPIIPTVVVLLILVNGYLYWRHKRTSHT